MRLSQHFGSTLRTAPGDVDVEGHRMLLRAGYVRQLASGIFSYLALGLRAMRKIEQILREEMNAIGGQEIAMPVVHPAELWQETGRWFQIGDEMARFHDRAGRDMLLGMTHEEVVADLARRDIQSYRQLPLVVYQIQTKFRDEPRPRAGLIRVREFTMKDSYSLDVDVAGLEQNYRNHYRAYFRIFDRVGLTDVLAVRSDTGMMGGMLAHEFMFLDAIGEDTLALCDGCGYAGNLQVARFRKPEPAAETELPREKVATPGTTTIEDLARFLGVPASRTAKAVFYVADVADVRSGDPAAVRQVLLFALIRGDLQVNEFKLANATRAFGLRPATAEEIGAAGAVQGYASPVGLSDADVIVVVDDLVARSPNLVGGANEEGYHYRSLNYGRDYEASVVADISTAYDGAACAQCGRPLRLERGVEVGNIFQLGTRYTEAMEATYLDAEGRARPIVMGSYGIGVGRLLACLAERFHDERGLTLPITVAPFALHLVSLAAGDDAIQSAADALYDELRNAGIEVLYDDRALGAGVKFADADLIGAPLRATVSSRSLAAGGIELKARTARSAGVVASEDFVGRVRAEVDALHTAIAAGIRDVAYRE